MRRAVVTLLALAMLVAGCGGSSAPGGPVAPAPEAGSFCRQSGGQVEVSATEVLCVLPDGRRLEAEAFLRANSLPPSEEPAAR